MPFEIAAVIFWWAAACTFVLSWVVPAYIMTRGMATAAVAAWWLSGLYFMGVATRLNYQPPDWTTTEWFMIAQHAVILLGLIVAFSKPTRAELAERRSATTT